MLSAKCGSVPDGDLAIYYFYWKRLTQIMAWLGVRTMIFCDV